MKQHGHNRINLIRILLVSFWMFQSQPLHAEIKFGEPVNMGPLINSQQTEGSMITSAGGLTRYFTSGRPGGYGSEDIWEVTRPTINDPWSSPKNLGPEMNSSSSEGYISFGPDELTLFLSEFCYSKIRPGGIGGRDLWISTRQSVQEPWSTPVNMGSVVNSSYDDYLGSVSTDGLELYFFSTRPGYGQRDLWVTSRVSLASPWEPPVNLGSTINTPHHDASPVISQDGLTLCFTSTRPGGLGSYDIYISTRLTKEHQWGSPTHLPQLCGPMIEGLGGFDPLTSCFSFLSNRSGTLGGFDLWSLPVMPVVDFNGDGIVDAADMCIMVDHWGTDNSLCDIGPMPWGDGIVDVQDLIVLAEHLFEEFPPVDSVEVNEENDGGQVELDLGQILVVTLESNPSTGYRWERVESNESILEQLGEAEFKPSDTGDPPPVGADGWEIFRFKATSPGLMTLKLVYHRSWEDVEPLKTFSIEVIVN